MHYCSQEEGNWYTTVLKEKETGALRIMFSGEGDWFSTVFWRRPMGLYCAQENGSGVVTSLMVGGNNPTKPHYFKPQLDSFWGFNGAKITNYG